MGQSPRPVERIVDAALGCEITASDTPADGRMAQTYLLTLDDDPGRAVCKIGGPSVRTGEVIEPAVVELVGAETDVPVPEVFASGTLTEQGTEIRWGLYEFCPGEPPTNLRSLAPDVRERVVRTAGSVLGRLHARFEFEQTGGIANGDGTGGLVRDGDRLTIRPSAGLDIPEQAWKLAQTHPSSEVDRQPVLTHGDLFPGNLLVDSSGDVTAVLDWGNAHVTTPGYALARAEMRFVDWFLFGNAERGRLRTALRSGYRQHRPLPPDLSTVGGYYKLCWLVQSADRIGRNLRSDRGRSQLRRHLRSLLPSVTGRRQRSA
ncbi:phosphotransferase family protein [Halovenus marina]|uniref:phosphotransferase family protein n=1 Tax=Halovenus marina TaxID=3396621 RepID=UPI003F573B38